METKKCSKCGIEKEISEFRKYKSYHRSECKSCTKEYNKLYREKNVDKIREYRKKYNKEHKEEIKIMNKKYREEHKEEIKEYVKKNRKRINETSRNWSKNNREKINLSRRKNYNKNKDVVKERLRKYYIRNSERIKENVKLYSKNNKEKVLERNKIYFQKNKHKINEKRKIYQKNRLKEDSVYKIKSQIRNLIKNAFLRKGMTKSKKTEEILGCDLELFYNYLLKTYKNNYGIEWDKVEKVHIDHIIPLSVAKTEEEVIKLNRYTNLQLLKEKDNLEKSNKIDWRLL